MGDDAGERPEIGDPELREVIVGAYRIIHRYRRDAIEVTTILHGARLFPGNDPRARSG